MKSTSTIIVGLQEPPDDFRIFNKRQENGTYKPISEFFEPED